MRKPLPPDVPPEWLDSLLIAVNEIEPGATLDQRLTTLLKAVATALPGCSLGVCIPDERSNRFIISSLNNVNHSHNPTRLFPNFSFESITSVESNTTLHIATDDRSLMERSAFEALTERLALSLRATIDGCRTQELLRNQIIQSEKLASVGQIAAGVAHELNNPLTSILAYSEFLRRKSERAGGDPADIERLMRINEAAERVLRFSRDLIAYSRPSTEKPAAVSIHDVIDRALGFCEHVLDEAGVGVEKTFNAIMPVLGVAGQLTQVFVNLFTNAAHAMRHRGGCLSVQTSMSDDNMQVAIAVGDEGHGIEPENLPRIFDPFFTTKTDGTGTGLGLCIVRSIVAAHGGTIRADARQPKGMTFSVEFPIATPCSTDP